MTDHENAQPAGYEPMTEEAAANLLMGDLLKEEPEDSPEPAEHQGAAPEQGADDDQTDDLYGDIDPAEASADDTTDDGNYYDIDKLDPEMKINLRDGSRVRWGDLKRDLAEARELQRHRQDLEGRFTQFQQTEAQIAQQRQYLNQVLPTAIQILQNSLPEVPPMPDPAMVQNDFLGYQEKMAAHLAAKEQRAQKEHQLRQFAQAQQAGQQEQIRRNQVEQAQYVQQEQKKLLDALPVLRDDKKRSEFMTDVIKYGSEAYGFTHEELARVGDHRTALVLRDAIAWRKLQARKPKADAKAQSAPPVQKPGKRASESEVKASAYRDEMTRLRKSGSMDDAAALILNHHLS
jgi:hypothetical protein